MEAKSIKEDNQNKIYKWTIHRVC